MRSNLSNNQSFRELLRSVRRICLEAYEHQDLPFEKLVEELQPKRDLSRTPLFQILFSYQENGEDTFLLNSIKLQQVPVHSGVARTDLSLWIENTDGELNCALEYSTHLFQPGTVRRFLKNYICLLEEICENADQKVSEIQILHKEAQNKVLNEWNDTKGAFPDDSTVIGLFEEQAKQSANKVAVESGGEKLSYSRLNERTNQVANYLTSIGVKAGDYVGICIDRSVEMLISMLAVLKSGAAYVPMDPIFPAERLEYMIDDAEVKVIITTSQLTDIFSGFNGQRILIDREWEKIKLQGNQSPDIKVRPDNLAYVIFTSGSTGKPKGVQIGHRSVVNFLLSMQNEPGIRSDDVLLSVTTISFDISVLELFLPLISGARLIIAPRSTTSDGKLLIKALKDSKATIMQGTPSTWKMMIEAGWRSAPDLKMLCGGEALPIELAKQMLARGESLWNMYGPTETTVWSAVKKIEPEDDAVYIGPPIANTQFYILDNELNPVPIGVPGELLIGGEGLARGYLNRPELTDEKFISNPFGESGSRLYRTGDLARYKSNGDIEFLGRLDHQVKIRGFRIELGEIENVLSEHTAIKDVAVNAWSDASGDKKLVAYYISESGETIQVSDFREFLRHKLPDYMIPSFFVRMDEFPLTPNKKIDRKALPAPDVSEVSTAEKYVPPRDELERELASIWQKILGVKAIGINDNFFDLGGHSLLAAQLFAQIEKRMGKNLPLALLFQAPTIAQLAEAVRNKDWENNRRATTPIEKVDRPEYLPLSFSQQRLWFLEKYEPNTPVYNIPMAYRIRGEFDFSTFGKAVNAVIGRHEILRTRFKMERGTPYQDILGELKLDIPLIDLSEVPSQEREVILSEQLHSKARNTFNISEGPLLNCVVFKLEQLDYVVLFVIHHIIFDGWSINVLLKELAQYYLSHLQGDTVSLHELPIQYADFSLWQRQWLKGDVLKHQLDYWKNQLRGELPPLELPTDFPRPAIQKYDGNTELFTIDQELAETLSTLGRQENSTLFMVLLTALYILIYRYSGQKDICVGTVIANRIRPELDELMGVFVNNLVMRSNLSNNQSFRELLRSVRRICLEA
ncbi:MAG: amino acid adenylation domain-containing protein, partial [Chlorobium sp.]|nr:amino acid adenylation domain-containing protein [Chlorobium sp.]